MTPRGKYQRATTRFADAFLTTFSFIGAVFYLVCAVSDGSMEWNMRLTNIALYLILSGVVTLFLFSEKYIDYKPEY